MRRRAAFAASLGVVAAACLPACSGSPAPDPVPHVTPARTGPAAHPTAPSPAAYPGFTVTGDNPVPPNGSQETRAAVAGTTCSSRQLTADRLIGDQIANGFAASSLPAAAQLLRHFLAGTGTAVNYPAGSPVARLALASSAFRAVNSQVQAAVARQLRAGDTWVRLSAAQLPTVAFNAAGGDLYWGFRGTQGLSVSGSVHLENGSYVGTLSYVIRDSYGFPAGDTLGGFGPPMRYLQTVCGAPQNPRGARWFPDTITVRVPFRQPAR